MFMLMLTLFLEQGWHADGIARAVRAHGILRRLLVRHHVQVLQRQDVEAQHPRNGYVVPDNHICHFLVFGPYGGSWRQSRERIE